MKLDLGDWNSLLEEEFSKDYMRNISFKIAKYRRFKGLLCPSEGNIFRALKECKYGDVKLVILGQDPYYLPDMADGLAFSTKLKKTPKSLANIFKEIKNDYPNTEFKSNSLVSWAKQGVLLLNTVLTTEVGTPNKHTNFGWQKFTNKVIELVNAKDTPVVFMLWGNYAKQYKTLINNKKHLILETSHPSPLSAYRGFLGSGHFRAANTFILKYHNKIINYST